MYKKKLRKYSHSSKLGYTLIELMIVVLIMTLVFALGIVRYRDFQRRQALESSARALITDLRFAQERSLAGTKPAGCTTLSGYILHRVSATSYDLRARCLPGPTDIIQKTELEIGFSGKHPGITLGAFPDVVFNNLGMGVTAAVNITLTQGVSGLTRVVAITQGGEIK